MKVRIEHISEGEEEVLIRCYEINEEVDRMVALMCSHQKKIMGQQGGTKHLLEPPQIYYCESVDNAVFAYTQNAVFKLQSTLNELENEFEDVGFFRCSKSMIININAITSLQSIMGNRIDATLKNKEHIIISRHYAKLLKEVLR